MTKILIAVDDTDHSIRAASTARALFGDDAEYFIISVLGSPAIMWGGVEAMRWGVAYPAAVPVGAMTMPYPLVVGSGLAVPAGEPGGLSTIDQAERLAGDVAVAANLTSATPIGDTGDPTPAILEAADAHDVDVIVVGSSHAGWLSRMFSRPVPEGVLRQAHRPVLVVP